MTLDQILNAYLTAQVTLAGGRVYTDNAKQGCSRPYVVIVGVSDVEDFTLSGHNGLWESHRQISCFADSGAAARAVEQQVVVALKAWSAEGIHSVRIEDRYTVSDEISTLFHRAVDVEILHEGE